MNRFSSLTALALLLLVVCGAFAVTNSTPASKFDCCYPGSPCCFPGSPCCETDDCCFPGSPCCFDGSPCCGTSAVKTTTATNVQKTSDCCAGR